MTRYNYNRSCVPPAPFVHVAVQCGDGSGLTAEWPALVDTGADRTIIPSEIVNALRLTAGGESRIGGLGLTVETLPSYLVLIAIRNQKPIRIEALSSPDESYILLGRDVLNHFRILLDGPGLVLEID